MNKYLAIIIAVLYGAEMQGQTLQPAPRLVVNITIDQLRTDYIEYFSPLFGQDGFRKLLEKGCVYEAASYPFSPVDRASGIATIATGTTPYYHGIIGTRWLDRKTLRPVFCADDPTYYTSAWRLATSTVSDELKVSSHGSAIVWSVAATREAAVLSAGHAANGALWIDEQNGRWRSSTYYSTKTPEWLKAYASLHPIEIQSQKNGVKRKGNVSISAVDALGYVYNDEVADASCNVVISTAMGRDDVPDVLSITLSAAKENVTNWQVEMENVYMSLDNTIGKIISTVENGVGADHVMFVVTSTGYAEEVETDLQQYRIPTGTFRIDRTANLLNMYLSAIYGQGFYVEACYGNQFYFNHQMLEQKHISVTEILQRSQEFLVMCAGVGDVYTSERLLKGNSDILRLRNGFNVATSGDIIIDVKPGWRLLNEETQESYTSRASFVPFPIIMYGAGTKPQHVTTPVTVDRIAPTIAKSIRIRAPNACSSEPLF
ncbi:MAG: alkaline phosphatase family protein [Prevotella sp.]|nr:alkaline phosphatase family protein [Prevotella sp.]